MDTLGTRVTTFHVRVRMIHLSQFSLLASSPFQGHHLWRGKRVARRGTHARFLSRASLTWLLLIPLNGELARRLFSNFHTHPNKPVYPRYQTVNQRPEIISFHNYWNFFSIFSVSDLTFYVPWFGMFFSREENGVIFEEAKKIAPSASSKKVQSHLFNTDTKGTGASVRFTEVSVLWR